MKTRAIVFEGPDRISLKTFDLAPCGPEDIICETIYSFVSPGTEMRVLKGVDEWAKFPFIPGYAWVGRVIEIGAKVKGWEKGQLVAGRNGVALDGCGSVWGGHAQYHRCPASWNIALKLPEGADPWSYVTTEVAAISWRGVSAAFPTKGETAVVIGQGLIGAFAAKWFLHHGARVIVTDIVPSRLERARKWGAAAALDGRNPDIREMVMNLTNGGADIVYEASSSKPGVMLASSIIRQPAPRCGHGTNYPMGGMQNSHHFWPRLVYQAGYLFKVEIAPGELTGGEGAIVLKPSDRTVGDRLQVIEQIRLGNLPVGDFVDKPTPVTDALQAFLALRDHPELISAIAFKW